MQMLTSGPGAGALTAFGERIEYVLARPWFPTLVNLAALVLLAFALARWTWQIVRPPVATTAAPLAAGRTSTAERFDLTALLGAQVFGVAPQATADNIENIPLSSLNLVLTGLIAAGEQSFALIRVEGQPEAPFAIGQEILPGAVLQAVYADRAIISRGGVAESLLLEGASQPLAGVMAEPDGDAAPAARTAPNSAAARIREQGQNSYVVPRDLIDQQLKNPRDMLSHSLMVPNQGGGFLIREIKPGSVYERLGLKVGDVIRTANGVPLNTIDDVMKFYRQSGSSSHIQLEVMRNGRSEFMQYAIQ